MPRVGEGEGTVPKIRKRGRKAALLLGKWADQRGRKAYMLTPKSQMTERNIVRFRTLVNRS